MQSASAIISCKGWGERDGERAPNCGDGGSVVSASAPASRTEIGVVYCAAIVQGLALVTFPAASVIFTGPNGFGFDTTARTVFRRRLSSCARNLKLPASSVE